MAKRFVGARYAALAFVALIGLSLPACGREDGEGEKEASEPSDDSSGGTVTSTGGEGSVQQPANGGEGPQTTTPPTVVTPKVVTPKVVTPKVVAPPPRAIYQDRGPPDEFIDERVRDYVEDFFAIAAAAGLPETAPRVKLVKISFYNETTSAELPAGLNNQPYINSYGAVCETFYNHAENLYWREVFVNERFWDDGATPVLKERIQRGLVYHELGHCVFEVLHDEEGYGHVCNLMGVSALGGLLCPQGDDSDDSRWTRKVDQFFTADYLSSLPPME